MIEEIGEIGEYERTARELAAAVTALFKKDGLAYEFRADSDFFVSTDRFGKDVVAFFKLLRTSGSRFVTHAATVCASDWRPDAEAAFGNLLEKFGSRNVWTMTGCAGFVRIDIPGASSAEELRIKLAAEGALP